MIGALLEDTNQAVRKPVLEVDFGSEAGTPGISSLLGGNADSWTRSLVSISIECGLAPSVDLMEMNLAADEQAPPISLADEGSLAFGYEDTSTFTVYSGVVGTINSSIGGSKQITVMNSSKALAHLRINQGYEQLSTGDVVSDLASQAGVDTASIEAGVDLPYFVIDDRRSALDHIAILARKNGFMAYFTVENKLYFGPPQEGEVVQSFAYGLDILNLQIMQTETSPDSITVIGAGAAGSQGKEAWPWLVKDPAPLTVEAGEGNTPRLRSDPSLRSSEAIQAAADGWVDRYGRTALRGRIDVPGAPAVVVGSTIDITNAPQEALNGSFWVCRVRHNYSKQRGFISIIDFTRIGGGGLL